MDILNFIAYQWLRCYMFLWSIADWCEDIPLVGGWLHDLFLDLAYVFFERDEEGYIVEECLYMRTLQLGLEIDLIIEAIKAFLSWETIKALIIGWIPGLEGAITVIENLVDEVLLFFQDPIAWIKDKWETDVWPWARENVWPLNIWYTWYINNKDELELFLDSPTEWIKSKFKDDVLPWALENIWPLNLWYTWYDNNKDELELFFDRPWPYILFRVQTHVLPWLKENVPLFSTLYKWYEEGEIEAFFKSPLDWLLDRFTDWFLGPEE